MPLGPKDQAFIDEVRQVLEKHGNENRFGLCLLHEHFPMNDDEILMETHDKDSRTITIAPQKRTELGTFKPTMWNLSQYEVLQGGADAKSPKVLLGCKQDKCK